MVTMAVFAVLACTVSAGGRISQERHSGWTRQLRLSALRPGSYVLTKAVVAVATAMLALIQLAQAPFGDSVDVTQGVLVRWRHRVATG